MQRFFFDYVPEHRANCELLWMHIFRPYSVLNEQYEQEKEEMRDVKFFDLLIIEKINAD